jgi:hypothetical protein
MINLNKPRTENNSRLVKVVNVVVIFMLIFFGFMRIVYAVPVGPQITFNSTSNATQAPAAAITTAGGTFTTLSLNTTGQTYRWKAYVGNVSGRLVLADATNYTIFDWNVASVSGEVYATRSNSVNWGSVTCAASNTINTEDTFMNMSSGIPDTINKTFNRTVHRSFYVGSVLVPNSTCRSVATFVNNTAQTVSENAVFQQVLLQDVSANLVYTTLVNASAIGYNANRYDFQMILAENEYQTSPTTYYLYVELT